MFFYLNYEEVGKRRSSILEFLNDSLGCLLLEGLPAKKLNL